MQMPKVLPEHTEFISKANALVAPSRCCTLVAVAGCMRSGDEVESTIPWRCFGGKSIFCRHRRAAWRARSEVQASSGAILLDKIPVFSTISPREEGGKQVNCSLGRQSPADSSR